MAKDDKATQTKNTNPYIAIVLIVIVLGAALGFVAAGGDEDSSSDTQVNKTETHSDGDSHSHSDKEGHSHGDLEPYEFASHDAVPSVAIQSVKENKDGEWVLGVNFENLEIREDKVDQENVPGEGHAHVYVNGEKVSRLFAEEYTFEDPLKGGDVVSVEINTNDHRPYTHDGVAIDDEFTVGSGHTDGTSHDSDDAMHSDEDDHMDHDSDSDHSHDDSHGN